MNNEENNKKEWQAPEIIDLDTNKTKSGGTYGSTKEATYSSVS